MKKLSIIISLLALPTLLAAQGLHKDIDVEQSITPVKRDASRINVLPTVSLPLLSRPQLSYSDWAGEVRVNPQIRVLDPVAWNPRPYGASSRGYVDLAIGSPLMQGGISAGYRPISTDATAVSLWGQYDGDVYRRLSTTWHDQTATLGVDASHRLSSSLRLGGSAFYTYGYHDMPGEWGRFSEGSSRVCARLYVDGSHSALDYQASLGYQRFGFCNPHWSGSALRTLREEEDNPSLDGKIHGTGENLYTMTLGGSLQMAENSWLKLGIDARLLAVSNHATALAPYCDLYMSYKGHSTRALVTLRPAYRFGNEKASATIGAAIDLSKNLGSTVKIAPDVTLAWHGIQYLAAEIKAHGGSTLNTLAELYQISPLLNPTIAYSRSHAPYIIDGKVAFGPFLGATLTLFGGYGRANDLLMPVAAGYETPGLVMEPLRVSGYRYGLSLGYDNGATIAFSASWQHSPSERKKAWLDCTDRASDIVGAKLSVRPISKIKVDIDYELRSGRCLYGYSTDPEQVMGLSYYPSERIPLGTVSDLSAGVDYRFSEPMTLFARAQNILSRRSLLLGGRPVQGFNILAGVALKF